MCNCFIARRSLFGSNRERFCSHTRAAGKRRVGAERHCGAPRMNFLAMGDIATRELASSVLDLVPPGYVSGTVDVPFASSARQRNPYTSIMRVASSRFGIPSNSQLRALGTLSL